MRHGLTHNGCVEEFQGSKCGAHFGCVNNERLTPWMRQRRVFQPNQERMKKAQRHFQQAARTWKENKKSILYILYRSSAWEHPRSLVRRLPTFLFRKWSVYFSLYRIAAIIELWPWFSSDWPEGFLCDLPLPRSEPLLLSAKALRIVICWFPRKLTGTWVQGGLTDVEWKNMKQWLLWQTVCTFY